MKKEQIKEKLDKKEDNYLYRGSISICGYISIGMLEVPSEDSKLGTFTSFSIIIEQKLK